MTVLGERLLEVHDALERAGIPHAVGGAIALAFCTEHPRGTSDLDINVFVGPDRVEDVFAALPGQITHGPAEQTAVRRDGQVRLWWQDTPVDLFFDVHEFHAETAAGVYPGSFLGRTIPVIGCTSLAVFKALYARTLDWADIEAMLAAGSIDRPRALAHLRRLLGEEHASVRRFAALCSAIGSE